MCLKKYADSYMTAVMRYYMLSYDVNEERYFKVIEDNWDEVYAAFTCSFMEENNLKEMFIL